MERQGKERVCIYAVDLKEIGMPTSYVSKYFFALLSS